MTTVGREDVEEIEREALRRVKKRKKYYNPKGKAAKKKSAEVAYQMKVREIKKVEEVIISQLKHGDMRARILSKRDKKRSFDFAVKGLMDWVRLKNVNGQFLDLDNEVEFEYTRSKGAGGQHINKVLTSVKIIHLPTGITAEDQNSRERSENERQAIGHLKRKLEKHLILWKELLELERSLKNIRDLGFKIRTLVYRVVYT